MFFRLDISLSATMEKLLHNEHSTVAVSVFVCACAWSSFVLMLASTSYGH